MIDLKYNQTMPRDYVKLMLKCGSKPCRAKTAIGAIKNSNFSVGVFQNEELIAFGRICGDGFKYMMMCDILVDPKYAGKNLEIAIIRELEGYIRECASPETTVLAQVDAPFAGTFEKLGYKYFDEDYQVVMKR